MMRTRTAGPVLEARSPAWLIAKADADRAARIARDRHGRVDRMTRRVEDHARDLAAKQRSGLPLITRQQSVDRGGGAGFEVVDYTCSCSADCEHPATQPPFSEAKIADAAIAAAEADEAHAAAVALLADTPQTFDAFANARENGSRFVWWPTDQNVDPRKRRYRGAPITDKEIADLGPHELRRAINTGAVFEVPT